MFEDRERVNSSHCSDTSSDLAQWYFWGGGEKVADLNKAYHYASLALVENKWPFELSLLHAAFVIAGLDSAIGVDEAVRRFRREILSGNQIRRDKALAMLNQLSGFLPHIHTSPASLYVNSSLTKPVNLPARVALQLPQNANKRPVLLADSSGAPSLYWLGGPRAARSSSVNQAVFQQYSINKGGRVDDVRQQLWQVPATMPHSGVLVSLFERKDGSPYESRCTATQLTSLWLLSASHCLFTPEGGGKLVSVNYLADPLDRQASDVVKTPVNKVWRHRQHRPEDQYNGEIGRYSGSDIALFKLARPITLAKPPALSTPTSDDPWVDSIAYPNDKRPNTLWASRCRANFWQEGSDSLSDLYVLDCFSYAGQSGAVLTQEDNGERQIVGVLSARIYNDEIDQPVFAALNTILIKEIQSLLAEDKSELFVMVPIGLGQEPSKLASAKP